MAVSESPFGGEPRLPPGETPQPFLHFGIRSLPFVLFMLLAPQFYLTLSSMSRPGFR